MNQQYFTHSIKGLVVGRFKAGKTRLMSSAYKAIGTVNGAAAWLCRPVLIIDCDGGTMSIPADLRHEPDTVYRGVTTEQEWIEAMDLARSGHFRLVLFDSWTQLFDKAVMWARRRNPTAKNANMDWHREARDIVANALEEWSDLAVRPETQGITLLSTAAVQDHYTGQFPNRVYSGERIQVAPTIEDRLVGRHNFVWHCTREDPRPLVDERGMIDIAATNAAKRSGELASRYLVFTDPFADYPYVKSQEGFASELDAIAWNLNLADILARHYAVEGTHTAAPATTHQSTTA